MEEKKESPKSVPSPREEEGCVESDKAYKQYLEQFLNNRSKRLYEMCDELDDEEIARKLQIIQTTIQCLQAVPH